VASIRQVPGDSVNPSFSAVQHGLRIIAGQPIMVCPGFVIQQESTSKNNKSLLFSKKVEFIVSLVKMECNTEKEKESATYLHPGYGRRILDKFTTLRYRPAVQKTLPY
jgi:hypothetical protein